MNVKISFFLLCVILFTVTCKDDKVSSPVFPKFEGITTTNNEGELLDTNDTTDWRIDDKFTELERNLFDTLKFDKTLHLKSVLTDTVISIKEKDLVPFFYPNPVYSEGQFYTGKVTIMNFVIVDSVFTKKIELRKTQNEVRLDLTSFNPGIYRMYYVFQDSSYNIIGLGHGDIKVYRE